jgi:hypothetical protein
MIHPFQFRPRDSQIFKIGKANSTIFLRYRSTTVT